MAAHVAPPKLVLAPASPAPRARVLDVRMWGVLVLVLAAATAVFGAFDALPFMDLPAHAGLIALRDRYASSPFEQQFYVLAPHVGAYSMFRLLGSLLATFLGPIGAVRTLAALSVVALPVALIDARRRLYGEVSPAFGFVGTILGFGLMTLFGFATFLFGVAVLVLCVSLWLSVVAEADALGPRWAPTRRELVMSLAAMLLFVSHGFAFVVFVGLAGVTALATGRRVARVVASRALVPALVLAGYSAWMERWSATPPGSAPAPAPRSGLLFQPILDKLSLLATPTLMTRTGIDIVVGVVLWVLVAGGVVATVAWLRRGGLRDADRAAASHARGVLWCVGVLVGAFVVLPHEVGWFGFVDGRVLLVLLLVATIGVPPQAIGKRLAFGYERIMPIAAIVVVGLALGASWAFQNEARGYHEVLARVPPYARVLNVPLDPNSDVFTGHPFVHYDKLVLAHRPVLVSDVWMHQGTALFPKPGNPALRLPGDYVSSDLRHVDWSTLNLDDWDYVLVRTKPSAPSPAVPVRLGLVAHVGGWWLYVTDAAKEARR